ncbi:prepilin peptidase [Cytophaga hutchinsonii]|uniref:Prepilin type IV endopeptidase peptidase domain-containing protein n=1 Tax=Cytophaga hutchinsonii (strain ATCC 33406 / DSM 1761 / CIP 103989 / NBRC 15051 / NCIMB 9469 / D465) TaxID=269798 RepID=A0A6N4SVN5_CYTH3|nr:prepilin peptidase [Cytophaga hutchinsonii]ABG60437.1 hypothetical protein CHU_3197 [Cytophaga hutchinsonii ATCC 33406]SFX85993.1 Type IV leader peptidase family protein [Cytophaga hutchinsonii ATCC 33406]
MTIHVLLLPAFLLILAVITYQDIKYRSVPIYVFLLALVLSIAIQYQQCGIDESFFIQLLFNSGFIAFNLLIVLLYVKKIKKIPLSSAIGLGDLAFYIVLIPVLSTPVYMYFHLISLVFILISYPVLKHSLSLQTKAIPLAGLQALCLSCFIIVFEYVTPGRPIIGSCSIIYWI